jgi:hypothetical protein
MIRELAEFERELHTIALYRRLGAEFRDSWKSVLLVKVALRWLAERKRNL